MVTSSNQSCASSYVLEVEVLIITLYLLLHRSTGECGKRESTASSRMISININNMMWNNMMLANATEPSLSMAQHHLVNNGTRHTSANWAGRCQSKCDLPRPHRLEKWFKITKCCQRFDLYLPNNSRSKFFGPIDNIYIYIYLTCKQMDIKPHANPATFTQSASAPDRGTV